MKYSELLQNLARKCDTGIYDIKLAEEYLRNNCWGDAILAVSKALDKLSPELRRRADSILAECNERQGRERGLPHG